MAALPEMDGLINLIDAAFTEQADLTPRAHLGASVLGHECARRGWYLFRWAITEPLFSGRILRLFARGQREEEWFATLLKLADCNVQTHDANGNQFSFKQPGLGGHLGGSLDGVVSGIPEAPGTWHVLECKTHNDKSFQRLCKEGVRASKPEHYDQMQMYLLWSTLDRALYMAVNKNDDSLYLERVAADKTRQEQLVEIGRRIILSDRPPAPVTDDPSWWQCKFCDFHSICHRDALPSVTCRTCLHATPLTGDRTDAAWHCNRYDSEIPLKVTRQAHPCHRYIPDLVTWAECVDATEDGEIVYRLEDGRTFRNGETQPAYLSTEMRVLDPALIGKIEPVKENCDARVVSKEAASCI